MPNLIGRSWTALRLLQGTAVVGLLLLAGIAPSGSRSDDRDRDAFLRETTRRWCASDGARDDLQAAIIDVRFHAEPPAFKPAEGAVVVWGERLGADLPAMLRRRIGVLLEDTRLPPFLSVRDALSTVGRVRGLRNRALKAEIDRVVAQTRVEPLLDRRVAVLSKGQARRAGLAAALVTDPPLLILDEPSAGLDVSAREEFNDLAASVATRERS